MFSHAYSWFSQPGDGYFDFPFSSVGAPVLERRNFDAWVFNFVF